MSCARIARLSILAGLLAPVAALAQDKPAAPPVGWVWHHDGGVQLAGERDPRDTAWTFVRMPPGWHITTGPGSVLYHPEATASGNYALSSEVFLFKRPTEEGYGLFFGGSAMGTDSASYLAVLLRRDGAVSLQAYRNGAFSAVTPWTQHAAIKPNPGDQIVENHLRVDVAADSLRVYVNDSSVVAAPRGALRTDGQFGFRVGRALNLHVTTLDHTRHLAPAKADAPQE